MMSSFETWAAQHPQAYRDLLQVIAPPALTGGEAGVSEARAQQQARLDIVHAGAMSWRNNVGATPAVTQHTCPKCRFHFEERQQPVRYGLANDSPQLNKRIKSGDLILAIPRIITPDMVGQKFAQFGSVEVKRPGWQYTGTKQEPAQAAWAALINNLGGFATFSTGKVEL